MLHEAGGAGPGDEGDEGPLTGRYRIVRLLGRGGMADVHVGVDEATGKQVALKRLHASRAGDAHTARLFELEFHTLAQLVHPRIVAVHDYHRHQAGAFYTMELLEGGDLSDQHGLPWKDVCKLLCDVCSALSLLHSRRLVHRDVTPRNIRRAHDGHAKLIDFGAMVPFGTHVRALGTPSFTAPEAITAQPLDGRADLYSLGATAYYVLTGRHAYPARTFANLRNAWRSQPALPSRYAPEVPPALDQLVMSLLSLAPSRRPASAGAVIERLTAIAGIELGEQLAVQRAFLTTPSLVGRDAIMPRIRRHMMRAAHGRGGSLFITGPRGVGRSRLVDACVLEAKLANAVVLRADADDGRTEAFGGARVLLDQLAIELPSKTASFVLDPQTPRPALQQALLALLLDVSDEALLVIASDDVDRIDEPTRALLALLADHAPSRRIAVVTAAESDAARRITDESSLALLREGDSIGLAPLSLTETERLLLSVFGDVPNVRTLASRLHEVSGGLPAQTMQLTQHLFDRELVRYRDGGWVLPSKLGREALPTDVSSALRARLTRLDPSARALAQAIALSGMPTLTLDDCAHVLAQTDLARVLHSADTLVTAQLLNAAGAGYALGERRWAPLLLADIAPEEKRALHARIAELFSAQPSADFHAAAHLLAAGEAGAAIDLLLAHQRRSVRALREHPARLGEQLRELPADYRDTLEAAAVAARELDRPLRQRFALRQLLLMYDTVSGELRPALVREVVEQLRSDSGLSDYEALPATTAAPERLQHALAAAQARYDAADTAERCFSPFQAVGALVQVLAQVNALTGTSGDFAFLSAQPSLWPFAALSPAITVVQLNIEATCHLFAGRVARARAGYLEMMAHMAAPGGDQDLGSSAHRYGELAIQYASALVEIWGGLPTVDERISVLERDPLFEVNAWRLRMLQALCRGDVESATMCERKAERLRIRNAAPQFFEGGDIWIELLAYVEIGDVTRIHDVLERIDARAERFPAWNIAAIFARGHIQLRRDDAEAAARNFEAALSKCSAGENAIWSACVRGLATALADCGRAAEARARGADWLEQARAAGLIVQIAELHFGLAIVELADNDFGAALRHLDAIAEIRTSWPLTAVFAGACHELAAKIALAQRDQAALQIAVAASAQTFVASGHPILIARHERLLQDAERTLLIAPASLRPAADTDDAGHGTTLDDGIGAIGRILAKCRNGEERIARALSLALTDATSHPRGMLYLLRDGRLSLARQHGVCPDPTRMQALVDDFLRGELEVASAIDPDDLVTSTIDTTDWLAPGGTRFAPMLLSHTIAEGLAITGVLVFDVQPQDLPRDGVLARISAALSASGDVTATHVPARARHLR